MGLSRLDDLSLWTQYSRTAGDTASSSSLASPRLFELFQVISLASPRLFELFQVIALCLYITWALSVAIVVEWILFRLPSCRYVWLDNGYSTDVRHCVWQTLWSWYSSVCLFVFPVGRIVGGTATSFTIFMKYDVDIRK